MNLSPDAGWLATKLLTSFSKRHIFRCRVLTVASSSTLRASVLYTYSSILRESTLLLVTLTSLSLRSSSHFFSFASNCRTFRSLITALSLAILSLIQVGFVFVFTWAPIVTRLLFVCLFFCSTSQVNSSGHGGTVSSPNYTFSWASLNKQLTSTSWTYFRL